MENSKERKTESLRAKSIKYEILRCFNPPSNAFSYLVLLRDLALKGLRSEMEYSNYNTDHTWALSWLNDLSNLAHDLTLLEALGESFGPGERIDEKLLAEEDKLVHDGTFQTR